MASQGDIPSFDLDGPIWCDSCRRLKEQVKRLQEEHSLNYRTLKQKIISTDLLIRKYQTKCEEHDSQNKRLDEITRKYDRAQRDSETLTHQLSLSLEDTEPLKKAKADLESLVVKKNAQIENLQDRLDASESLCRQYEAFRKNSLDFDSEKKTVNKKVQQLESSNKKLEQTVSNLKNEVRTYRFEANKSNNQIKSLEAKLQKTLGRLEVYWEILKENGLVPRGDRRPSQVNVVDVDPPQTGPFSRSTFSKRASRTNLIDIEEDSMQEVPFCRMEKKLSPSIITDPSPRKQIHAEEKKKKKKAIVDAPLSEPAVVEDTLVPDEVQETCAPEQLNETSDDDEDADFDAVSMSSEWSFKFTMSPVVPMLSPLPTTPLNVQNDTGEDSSSEDENEMEIINAFRNDNRSDNTNSPTPELNVCDETTENHQTSTCASPPVDPPTKIQASSQKTKTAFRSFKLQQKRDLRSKTFNMVDDEDHGDDNKDHGDDDKDHGDDDKNHGDKNKDHGNDDKDHGDDNKDHGDDNKDHGDDDKDHGDEDDDGITAQGTSSTSVTEQVNLYQVNTDKEILSQDERLIDFSNITDSACENNENSSIGGLENSITSAQVDFEDRVEEDVDVNVDKRNSVSNECFESSRHLSETDATDNTENGEMLKHTTSKTINRNTDQDINLGNTGTVLNKCLGSPILRNRNLCTSDNPENGEMLKNTTSKTINRNTDRDINLGNTGTVLKKCLGSPISRSRTLGTSDNLENVVELKNATVSETINPETEGDSVSAARVSDHISTDNEGAKELKKEIHFTNSTKENKNSDAKLTYNTDVTESNSDLKNVTCNLPSADTEDEVSSEFENSRHGVGGNKKMKKQKPSVYKKNRNSAKDDVDADVTSANKERKKPKHFVELKSKMETNSPEVDTGVGFSLNEDKGNSQSPMSFSLNDDKDNSRSSIRTENRLEGSSDEETVSPKRRKSALVITSDTDSHSEPENISKNEHSSKRKVSRRKSNESAPRLRPDFRRKMSMPFNVDHLSKESAKFESSRLSQDSSDSEDELPLSKIVNKLRKSPEIKRLSESSARAKLFAKPDDDKLKTKSVEKTLSDKENSVKSCFDISENMRDEKGNEIESVSDRKESLRFVQSSCGPLKSVLPEVISSRKKVVRKTSKVRTENRVVSAEFCETATDTDDDEDDAATRDMKHNNVNKHSSSMSENKREAVNSDLDVNDSSLDKETDVPQNVVKPKRRITRSSSQPNVFNQSLNTKYLRSKSTCEMSPKFVPTQKMIRKNKKIDSSPSAPLLDNSGRYKRTKLNVEDDGFLSGNSFASESRSLKNAVKVTDKENESIESNSNHSQEFSLTPNKKNDRHVELWRSGRKSSKVKHSQEISLSGDSDNETSIKGFSILQPKKHTKPTSHLVHTDSSKSLEEDDKKKSCETDLSWDDDNETNITGDSVVKPKHRMRSMSQLANVSSGKSLCEDDKGNSCDTHLSRDVHNETKIKLVSVTQPNRRTRSMSHIATMSSSQSFGEDDKSNSCDVHNKNNIKPVSVIQPNRRTRSMSHIVTTSSSQSLDEDDKSNRFDVNNETNIKVFSVIQQKRFSRSHIVNTSSIDDDKGNGRDLSTEVITGCARDLSTEVITGCDSVSLENPSANRLDSETNTMKSSTEDVSINEDGDNTTDLKNQIASVRKIEKENNMESGMCVSCDVNSAKETVDIEKNPEHVSENATSADISPELLNNVAQRRHIFGSSSSNANDRLSSCLEGNLSQDKSDNNPEHFTVNATSANISPELLKNVAERRHIFGSSSSNGTNRLSSVLKGNVSEDKSDNNPEVILLSVEQSMNGGKSRTDVDSDINSESVSSLKTERNLQTIKNMMGMDSRSDGNSIVSLETLSPSAFRLVHRRDSRNNCFSNTNIAYGEDSSSCVDKTLSSIQQESADKLFEKECLSLSQNDKTVENVSLCQIDKDVEAVKSGEKNKLSLEQDSENVSNSYNSAEKTGNKVKSKTKSAKQKAKGKPTDGVSARNKADGIRKSFGSSFIRSEILKKSLTVDSCDADEEQTEGLEHLQAESRKSSLRMDFCNVSEQQTDELTEHPELELTESSSQDKSPTFVSSQNENSKAKKVQIETQTSFGFSANPEECDEENSTALQSGHDILELIPELDNEDSKDGDNDLDSSEENALPLSFMPKLTNCSDRVNSPETASEEFSVEDCGYLSVADLIQSELRMSASSPVHLDMFEIIQPVSPLPSSPVHRLDSPVLTNNVFQDTESFITESATVCPKKRKKSKKKSKLLRKLQSEPDVIKAKIGSAAELAPLKCGMKRNRVAHQPKHGEPVHKLPKFASEAPLDAIAVKPLTAVAESRVGMHQGASRVDVYEEEMGTSVGAVQSQLCRRFSLDDKTSSSKPAGCRLRANSLMEKSEMKGVKRKRHSETSLSMEKTEHASIPSGILKMETKKTAFEMQLDRCLNDESLSIDVFIAEISENLAMEMVWNNLVAAVIKHLQNCTMNMHAEVYEACAASDTETRLPLCRKNERILLNILRQFFNIYQNAPKCVLMEGLWKAVFIQEKDSVKLYGKQALCRVFVSLCQLEGDLEQARVFLFYVITCRHLSFPCICLSAVSVWPLTLIKTQQDANPVVLVMECIIMKSLSGDSTKTKNKQIADCFAKLCGWSKVPRASEDVLRQAVEKLDHAATLNQTAKVFELVKSVELLLVYEGWSWLHSNFILKHFMSVRDRWVNKAEESLSPLYVQSMLKIIGGIFRLNVKPDCKDVNKLVDRWLVRFLNRETAVAAVPLCSADVVLDVSPFVPVKAINLLLSWSKKHRDIITDEFEEKLNRACQLFSARVPMFGANISKTYL